MSLNMDSYGKAMPTESELIIRNQQTQQSIFYRLNCTFVW
jgi:hypothetical protein